MYTVTKNTKILSLLLMIVGLAALSYGFFQGAAHYSDAEVGHEIRVLAEELHFAVIQNNEHADQFDHDDRTDFTYGQSNDMHYEAQDDIHGYEAHFSPLYYAIEEKFNLHFSQEEMSESHDLEHVIHNTVHALHAKSQRPWSSLLVASIFFLGASLLSVFFLALQYVAEVGWSVIIKRVLMCIGAFLPYVATVIFLVIITAGFHLFGNHTYHWMAVGIMNPESSNYDPIIAGKEVYLNFGFFLIRAIIYFAGWIFALRKLTQLSLQEDIHGGLEYYNRSKKVSAVFIVFFAVTSSMLAWDWIMSIDTHWFSTLFGWYVFSSMFVTALVVVLITVVHLKSRGMLTPLNENHIHDLGKFIFAFSIFWTYLWFSQFMLIWYANIPEEVTYYIARFDQYSIPFMTALGFNFVVPIIMLMSRDAKRYSLRVIFIGLIVLIGHYLDFYVMIMPGTVGSHWQIGFVEIGIFLGYTGLFIYVVTRKLASIELIPKNHPMLKESKNFHI
jgi:hypothetical protein